MRCIIAGSRSIDDKFYDSIKNIINTLIDNKKLKIDIIISGHATGVDKLGEKFAAEYNIPTELYIPDWSKNGKKAGYLRNEEMANNADCLILFWDGESKGSEHTLKIAKKKGLKIYGFRLVSTSYS